jgi:hypothetical protein
MVLASVLLGGCAMAPSAVERPNARARESRESRESRETGERLVVEPLSGTRETPFEPRGGVVILGPEGRVIVMQLWEGAAAPESGCPSGLPEMPPSTWRDVATLHVMPVPGPSAPSRANGYRFDEDTFAAFSGRLFEQKLNVIGVKLPAKLEGGTTIVVPVGLTDVAGASVYEGRVRVFVCDLSK